MWGQGFLMRGLVYLWAVGWCLGWGASLGAFETEKGAGKPNKWALLVGIDRYPHLPPLKGCVNDVNNLADLLEKEFFFPSQNVRRLRNEEATRQGILDAFRNHLIKNAEKGDLVVFLFSGHGSREPDLSGDEIDDWDETLVPYDSRDPESRIFDISDDEMEQLLDGLAKKGAVVSVILDSCHSGSGLKGFARSRFVPPDQRPRPQSVHVKPSPPKAGVSAGFRTPGNDDYVLVAASGSLEFAYETRVDDLYFGALSYFLVKELRELKGPATWRDIMDKVCLKVNRLHRSQHPHLEGARADDVVFGDENRVSQPYVLVDSRPGGRLVLKAGAVHGITVGSVFEIYPPGTSDFDGARPAAVKVTVTNVGPFQSFASLPSGKEVDQASRAVARFHQHKARRLHVCIQPSQRLTFASLALELAAYPVIKLVSEGEPYHLKIRHDVAKKRVLIEGGDGALVIAPLPVGDASLEANIVKTVVDWAKWFHVLSIGNPADAPRIELRVSRVQPDGARKSPFVFLESLRRHEAVFRPGEEVELEILNLSDRDLFITILDLADNGEVSVAFPASRGGDPLKPGGFWREKFQATLPPTLDPATRQWVKVKSTTDVLKVFATRELVDLSYLEKAPLKRGGDGGPQGENRPPLESILDHVARGSKINRTSYPSDAWSTVQSVLCVEEEGAK